MQLTDRIAPAPDVVAREVAGEMVLMDLASGTYFGLDPIGTLLWHWASEAAATAAEPEGEAGATLATLCDRLTGEYEVSRAVAEADVLALARDLETHGLVRRLG